MGRVRSILDCRSKPVDGPAPVNVKNMTPSLSDDQLKQA
jgi:hypothetical protein